MQRTATSSQRGFTFTEMMATLGLLAGVLGLAVPSLQGMVHSAGLRGASGDLVADLVQARAEAMMRNRRVALCKSARGLQCEPAGGWEQGWILFQDDNGNGTLDGHEQLISRREALAPQYRLVGNQPVAKYISYTPIGATKLAGGGFQAGTLTLCRLSATPTSAHQVVLNSIGRPRVQKATVDSCV